MTLRKNDTPQPASDAGTGLYDLPGTRAKEEVERPNLRPWKDAEFDELFSKVMWAQMDEADHRRTIEMGLREMVRRLKEYGEVHVNWRKLIDEQLGALVEAEVEHGLLGVEQFVESYEALDSRFQEELLQRVCEEFGKRWTIKPKA